MTGWNLLSNFANFFAIHGLTQAMSYQLIKDCNLAPESVLIIGAGTGVAVRPFADLGSRLLALDHSSSMVARCYDAGIPCVIGEAASLPVSRCAFDLVVLVTGVLDCTDDLAVQIILRDCHRATQDGGALVTTHFDHSQEAKFYYQWGLATGDRVLTQRKIALWREYERHPHKFEGADRIAVMSGFFRALQAATSEKHIPFDEVLAALPSFQVIRSPARLSMLLARAGWRAVSSGNSPASGAFYLLARKESGMVM